MAKAEKPEMKFIAVNSYGEVETSSKTLQQIVVNLKGMAEDDGVDLSEYIGEKEITVYEVVAAIEIEEKVTRTILINGQPASF